MANVTQVDISIFNSVAGNLFNLSDDCSRVVSDLNSAKGCLSGELAAAVDLSAYCSATKQIGENYSKLGSAVTKSV